MFINTVTAREMTWWAFLMLSLMLSLVIYFIPSVAFAQAEPMPGAPECVREGGLTYYAVCNVRGAFNVAVDALLPVYIDIAETVMGVVMTIALTIFGIRMMFGAVPRLGAEAFVLLFKIAVIIYAMDEFDYLYEAIIGTIEDFMMIVTEPLQTSAMAASCQLSVSPDDTLAIWQRADCMLGALFGFGAVSGGLFSGFGVILTGAVGSSVENDLLGSIGPMIIMFGATMMLGLLFAVFRAVFMYLIAYLSISFLIILGPLVFLCLLFKRTKPFFDRWLKLIFSLMLQPILIFAFLTLMIICFDKVLFESPNSLVAKVSGGCTACNINNNCDPAVTSESGGVCTYEVLGRVINQMQADDSLYQCYVVHDSTAIDATFLLENNCLRSDPQYAQQRNRPGDVNVNYIDWSNPECRAKFQESMSSPAMSSQRGAMNSADEYLCIDAVPEPIFGAIFVVVLMLYVLYVSLMYVPDLVTSLTTPFGEGRIDVGNVSSAMQMPLEQPMRGAIQSLGEDVASSPNAGFNAAQTGRHMLEGFLSPLGIRRPPG
jgi:hypothetical protein